MRRWPVASILSLSLLLVLAVPQAAGAAVRSKTVRIPVPAEAT
jgi:hypothetical protein